MYEPKPSVFPVLPNLTHSTPNVPTNIKIIFPPTQPHSRLDLIDLLTLRDKCLYLIIIVQGFGFGSGLGSGSGQG